MCILDFKKYNFPKIFDQTFSFYNIKANNMCFSDFGWILACYVCHGYD